MEYGNYLKIDGKEKKKYEKEIENEINVINKEMDKEYSSPYASLNLSKDDILLKFVKDFGKKYDKVSSIYVIGIGGSNLGTKAIVEAIYGTNANLINKKKIYFCDTVDVSLMEDILNILESDLKKNKKILVNVISKSGKTTETVAFFQILKDVLKKYKRNLSENVVITTGKGSLLYKYAMKEAIPSLTIPSYVGGRYSVFSAVGLFPLFVYGVDVDKLLEGAKKSLKENLSLEGISSKEAMRIYFYYKNKVNMSTMFLFKPYWESLGKWYRQLTAESLGKEDNIKGKKIFNGITPCVAIGSTDLHSMAQLYLGGPKDKYFKFVFPFVDDKLKIQKDKNLSNVLNEIQGKNVVDIMEAIENGVLGAFKKMKIPFSKYYMDNNEYSLGWIMQSLMIETIFLGKLMNVNPFDQPNVELYKKITRKEMNKDERR